MISLSGVWLPWKTATKAFPENRLFNLDETPVLWGTNIKSNFERASQEPLAKVH